MTDSRSFDLLYRFHLGDREPVTEDVLASAPIAPTQRHGPFAYYDHDESTFHRIPEVRAWLAGAGIPWIERGYAPQRPGIPPDPRAARLVPAALSGVTVRSSELTEQRPCPACSEVRTMAVDLDSTQLAVDRIASSVLVGSIGRDQLPVAHRRIIDELGRRQLLGGLTSIPIDGAPDHVLVRATPVDGPAAPYGYLRDRCDSCGSDGAGKALVPPPRYAFYKTYERPTESTRWLEDLSDLPFALIVDGAVLAAVVELGAMPGLLRRGWYPDDAEEAFLPVEYHAR